ncbi:MAG: PKD domain-containing protein, partial [Bacteroidota bacterium]
VVVLDDFDIYAAAGNVCDTGIMHSTTLTAGDATLTISMPLVNNRPSTIAAIEIIELDGSTGTGPKTAQLVFDHDGTNASQTVDLTGEGVDAGGNQAPVAGFTFSTDGLLASFTDTSTDSDGTIASRDWDFGDGNSSTGENPDNQYAADGTYTVTLTVTDDQGATDSISQDVTVAGTGTSTLTASPLDVDFGQVQFGTTSNPVPVTLTNSGPVDVDVTSVTLEGTDASEFGHDFTSTITVPAGATSTVNVTFSPTSNLPPPPPLEDVTIYQINAGGAVVGAFTEDSETTPSAFVNDANTLVETHTDAITLDASVPAGTPVEIFQSVRRDAAKAVPDMEWTFPVTAGNDYEVRMYFSENSRCSVGGRIFDVVVEGTVVLDDFDIFVESGSVCDTGIMRSTTLTAGDADINISMPLVNSRPSTIAAIEVIELDGGGTIDDGLRAAELVIDHTGSNLTQRVDLAGQGVESGGNQTPVAAFTFEATDLSVDFTDASTDDGTIASWSWDLGDGNASTDQNPTHVYAAAGTYTVELTVTDDGGLTGTTSQDVTVTEAGGNVAPTAAFTFAATDLSVDFTDASTDSDGTIASWSWDLGDGNTSTDQNPTHVYAAAGTYTVELTVTDDGGLTGTASQDVTVTVGGGSGAFTESAGQVVMEAENFHQNIARGDHVWVESTANADFSGAGAMLSDPDNNVTIKKSSASTSSPELIFDVDFTNTGSYLVWARVFAPNVQGSTVHLGLDDTISASKMETTTFGAWTWINLNTKGDVQSVNVGTAGVHTVHVWMRSDGLSIDKILLTTDNAFVPTGQGPAESPQAGPAVAGQERGMDMLDATAEVVELPEVYDLKANYPNPFNPTTTIAFDLPEASDVRLEVYDMMGRRVATLVNGSMAAGRYESTWNARADNGASVASGVYIYRLRAGSFESVKQMVLMK